MKTLRLYGAGLLVALLLVLAACGLNSPDFTISLNPTSLTVPQGDSGTTQLTITFRNGFAGRVYFSQEGAPSGVSFSLTRKTESNPMILDLTISVDSGVAPGTYNIQIKATGEGITRTAALSLTVTAPRAGTTWTSRTSQGNPLNGVAYGNGLFVAVGGYSGSWFNPSTSIILTSPDGAAWTQRTSPTSNPLRGVAYGNGLFVAVGAGGTILTSPDGVRWTAQTSGTGNDLYGVT